MAMESTDERSTPTAASQRREVPWLSHNILIAVVPAVGYAYAFLYELGIANRFGIPFWAIRPELSNTFLASALVAAAWVVAWQILDAIPAKPWRLLLYLAFEPLSIVLWTTYFLFKFRLHGALVWLIAGLFFSFSYLIGISHFYHRVIGPIRKYKDKGTWWDRWRERSRMMGPFKPYSVADNIIAHDERNTLLWLNLTLSVLVLVGLGLFQIGNASSRIQKDFLITSGSPCIVIRRYAETLICAPVDTSRQWADGSMRFLPAVDSNRTMHWISMHRLRTPNDTVNHDTRIDIP